MSPSTRTHQFWQHLEFEEQERRVRKPTTHKDARQETVPSKIPRQERQGVAEQAAQKDHEGEEHPHSLVIRSEW